MTKRPSHPEDARPFGGPNEGASESGVFERRIVAGARTRFSFPGKTFLVGEYLALSGGPSIVLCTEPRFELTVSTNEDANEEAPRAGERSLNESSLALSPFHPASPAGCLINENAPKFQNTRIQFYDPHAGLGGLGASTAQYAGVWAYLNNVSHIEPEHFDWASLLRGYRRAAWSGDGAPPSGADLVAQLTGGVCWFDGIGARARRLKWEFADLSFTLIRTGVKLATHEHLKAAQRTGDEAATLSRDGILRDAVGEALIAFDTGDSRRLIRAVEAAACGLESAGLCAKSTQDILSCLRFDLGGSQGGVLAAKGCGAMGADVILCLHAPADGARINEWVKAKGLKTCGGAQDVASAGLLREVF
jgi:mevalonate kinase